MVAKELGVSWIGARTGTHPLVLIPLPLHLVEVAVCLLGARLARRFLPVFRIRVARIVHVADRLVSSAKQYVPGKREIEQNGERGHPAGELVAADAGKRRWEIKRSDLLVHSGGNDGGRARFRLCGRRGDNGHGGGECIGFALIVEDKAQLASFFQKARGCIEERVFERERRQIIRARCAGLDLANLRDGFGRAARGGHYLVDAQRCPPALRQMSLYSKGVRIGLFVCRVVLRQCHERGFSVLDVPFVKRVLAKVRLAVRKRTRWRGNGGATLDTRKGNLDITVACHANGDAAVKVVRVEKRCLVHVAFRKRRDLKDGRAFVIGRGGELLACGIARCERDLGTRDGRILVGDVDYDHAKHGAREHQDLEGIIFIGVCLGGRERQYEGVCASRHARQHNARQRGRSGNK